MLAHEDRKFSVTSVHYVVIWRGVTRDRGQYQTLATCPVCRHVSTNAVCLINLQRVSNLHLFKSKSVTAYYYHTYHTKTDLLLSVDIDYYRLMPFTGDHCRDMLQLGHPIEPLLYSYSKRNFNLGCRSAAICRRSVVLTAPLFLLQSRTPDSWTVMYTICTDYYTCHEGSLNFPQLLLQFQPPVSIPR